MAKGPVKKAAKKAPKAPVRPVASPSKKAATKHKPTAKVVTPSPKPQAARAASAPAKPTKAAKPAPVSHRQILPPPAPPPRDVNIPSTEAVSVFERGMAALQRHDYKTASAEFQTLLTQFPTEGFIIDRARVYLELATRELRRKPAGSGSVEERITAATHALNEHNDDEAEQLAAAVLKDDQSQDLAAYLLAVVASRRGDIDAALAHLRNAININPECRLQARQDEEFDPLMDSDDFHLLIEAPASATTSPTAALGRKPVRKAGR